MQPSPDCLRPPATFIVGVPRSGTTLLRLMLDAHPRVSVPPETGFLAAMARRRWLWPPHVGRRRFVRHLVSSPAWPDFHLSPESLRAAVDALPVFTLAEGVRAFYALYAARFGKPLWGDKTPLYGPAIDAIGALLPEARFVHIIRDGRDVAVSLRPLWFAPGRDIRTLATYWADFIERTRRAGSRVPHYLEVRYETLTENPERELRRLCDFLSLDFDAAMLDYHTHAADRLSEHEARIGRRGQLVVSKPARLAQQERTASPPDASRAHRWRSVLHRQEIDEFETAAGEWLAALGYARR